MAKQQNYSMKICRIWLGDQSLRNYCFPKQLQKSCKQYAPYILPVRRIGIEFLSHILPGQLAERTSLDLKRTKGTVELRKEASCTEIKRL